jgi:NhaC family Na+:H+ antiporter
MTGSSWTTIATIGIALLGIGKALGFHEGWIAGAIISGAYFGDKISPMSETTVLASSTTGTPLFVHIKYMMYTTIPAFLIGLLIFMVAGWNMADAESVNVSLYAEGLSNAFTLSPWLMIVPIVTAVMIARRLPAIVILFCATIMACVAAVVAQSELVDSIAGSGSDSLMNRFRGVMILVYGSTGLETGVPELNDLVATRGMAGMMSTVWLIFCAMIFGASMSASGMIESIMRMFVRMARNTFTLVGSTVGVGLFMNVVCDDQYLSLILTGNMFKEVYQKMGYENRLLSRTTEDAVTVTSVLVPWNSCGMTQSMVLGVSTLVYLPYCFFNYLSPCFTLLLAAMEYKIRRKH